MIEIKNLTKKYNQKIIFENLNIDIDTRKVNIIVGVNGSGKTTLVNILSKVELMYKGKISGNEDVFTCFSDDYLPMYATIMNLISYYKLDQDEYKKISNKLDFNYHHTIYKNLSFGNKQKLKLIFTLLHKNKFFIFDEPTNGLDIVTIKNLIILLKEQKQGMLIITHDFYLISKLNDQLFILRHSQLEKSKYQGNVLEYLDKVIEYE